MMVDRRIYRGESKSYEYDGLDYKRLGARLRMEREYVGLDSVKRLVEEMEERTGYKPSIDSVYRFEKGARPDLSFIVAFCLTICGAEWWYMLRDIIADVMPLNFDIAQTADGPSLREYTRAEKLFGDMVRPQPYGMKPLSCHIEIPGDPENTFVFDEWNAAEQATPASPQGAVAIDEPQGKENEHEQD